MAKEIVPSEHQEQVAFVRWAQARGVFVMAIPNGGLRDRVTGAKMRQEGALAGAPDLLIALDGGGVLWLEMKRRKGGRISDVQKVFHQKLEEMGHKVVIGYGANDAMMKVQEILSL